ncbi:putative NADPH-dependent methylglyoxal reductase GRP2 [Podospora aff. communis PSN243]|uniref:NADPH-dependent methylglyoxal reductase GRP2 n=1 Tax=Podospora aff. communis PSN243 TaxID=3040156 RepID=A0AAV9GDM4_9PEZI|nr:putative NADPH-dependent methylglyoxal reductase GRP2 [Podospora aff. communis PSN243]
MVWVLGTRSLPASATYHTLSRGFDPAREFYKHQSTAADTFDISTTQTAATSSHHTVRMRFSRDLVLITGATGHVGSCTLLHLLESGYHVRAAVRSEAKIAAVLSRPQIRALNPGPRLTFTIVPDISVPGAYDHAVDGVTHIIHIASPLATGDSVPADQHDEFFIRPAVQGTLNLLEAANMVGTVRRVVITSSIVALVPYNEMEGITKRSPLKPVSPNDRIPFVPGPYKDTFAAYAASKVASLHHAEAWMARERPAFDAVYLHPGFVLGRNDTALTPGQAMQGTNSVVLALLLGKRFGPYAGTTVHAEDVARAHIMSLDPSVFGNQSYILSQNSRWNDAREIARRCFPEAIKSKMLVMGGSVKTTNLPVDTSLTEETFGFKFASYEEQVKSTVSQFLELRLRKGPKFNMSGDVSVKQRGVFVSARVITC